MARRLGAQHKGHLLLQIPGLPTLRRTRFPSRLRSPTRYSNAFGFELKIVENPRNEVALVQRTLAKHSPPAFLEEIRSKGIRCLATFFLSLTFS